MTAEQAIQFLKTRPSKFGKMVGFTKLEDMHNQWIIDMLTGKEDETLQAHRGSYKTTCVSIALSLIIILLPRLRTMFMRKTDMDTKEVLKQVQKILLDPHTQFLVRTIYGINLQMVTQTQSEIVTNLSVDVKGTPQLMGIGLGASITGKHFDRIFTDDIVNVSDRVSKAERERTKLIYQELQNVKNQGGRIFNTGTPWHKEDAFVLMPNPKKFDCHSTGLMSAEEIDYARTHMSPSLFAANYELKHIADENMIFPEPAQGADASHIRDGLCQLDAAYYGEDYTAFTVMVYEGGKYYALGKMWRKHVEDCYGEILNLYTQFACGKMYIEKNADKGMVSRDLRNLGMRTVNYNEGMNKHIKISTYLKAIWADVIFVDGTDPEYIEQICDYTEDAQHDDAPDSIASLARIMYPRIARREGRRNIVNDVMEYEE